MFEWLKDYRKFRDELRNIKVEDFNELKNVFQAKEQLEVALINQRNEYEKKLADQKLKNDNEVMSLNHAITLERARINHELNIKLKEFEKDKETILLQVKQESTKERGDFLEKNYGDLKDISNQSFDKALKTLGLLMEKLPSYRNKRIESDGNSKGIDVNVEME